MQVGTVDEVAVAEEGGEVKMVVDAAEVGDKTVKVDEGVKAQEGILVADVVREAYTAVRSSA